MLNRLQIRLWIAFLAVIVFLFSITVLTAVTQSDVLKKYDALTTTELEIIEVNTRTKELRSIYLQRIRDIENKELESEYTTNNNKINELIKKISISISEGNNNPDFIGLKKLIASIQGDYEMGISAVKNGNPVEAFSIYDETARKTYFVEDNISHLLFDELNQTQALHEQLETGRKRIYTWGIILSAIGITLCVIFSFIFTQRITQPLVILRKLTNEIQKGNFDFQIPRSLTTKKDETGALANAFNKMRITVKESLESLKKSNEILLNTKKDVEKKNKELQKINRIMVGRELRMIDLKRSTSNLEKRLSDVEKAHQNEE